MRSKDGALMEQIHSYIDEYYLREEETPSTTDIAREFSISRSSAYRYLVAMAEKKLIGYADGIRPLEATIAVHLCLSSSLVLFHALRSIESPCWIKPSSIGMAKSDIA